MKKLLFLCIVFIVGVTNINASKQYGDLIKLVKSGASDTVVVAYINESDSTFDLSSNEIVQLKESGASPTVIITAIQHKGKVPANDQSKAMAGLTFSNPSTRYITGPGSRQRWAARNPYEQKLSSMNQALQFDVVGALFGTYTVNYEYLLGHEHGIVLEGNYFYDGFEGTDSHGENAEVSYRWHMSRSMNSGFLGLFIKGNRPHGTENDLSGTSVEFVQTSITVGPNIGARLVSLSGFSVVGRIGYGFCAWSKFDNAAPGQRTKDLLQQRSELDSELSIGYAF